MTDIYTLLASFSQVSGNPTAQLEKYIASGKKVIGVGPYYVPEEIVYAAGAIPFGVWGAVGPAVEAKKYFPPFYCSICQTTLEMGLTHKLDKLSGMMVTGLCDTLRAFSQNWKAGVSDVPMIYVSHPQNRHIAAGRDYAISSYTEVTRKVEECCGSVVENDALSQAIKLYNDWRGAMRSFVELAGGHPAEVSISSRSSVINAGYFMDKADHLAMVQELNVALTELPLSQDGFKKIVLSGIYEDIPAITDILEQGRFVVVADDIAKESRAFSLRVPEVGDPLEALADGWCGLEADSVLFDPEKAHIDKVVKLARESGAQGVVHLLAKFCDPEEFDAPLLLKAVRDAGIQCITVEIDQSTESYEQARTQFEAFGELLG